MVAYDRRTNLKKKILPILLPSMVEGENFSGHPLSHLTRTVHFITKRHWWKQGWYILECVFFLSFFLSFFISFFLFFFQIFYCILYVYAPQVKVTQIGIWHVKRPLSSIYLSQKMLCKLHRSLLWGVALSGWKTVHMFSLNQTGIKSGVRMCVTCQCEFMVSKN